MKKILYILVGIVLFVLALVAIYGVLNGALYLRDSAEYDYLASNLYHHGVHYCGDVADTKDVRLYTKRTLGYPLFFIFQFMHEDALIIAQCCLGVFLFLSGLYLLYLNSTSRIGVVLYTLFYMLLIVMVLHVSFVMADLLLGAVVMSTYLWLIGGGASKHTYLSVLWLFAVLVKPIVLVSLFAVPVILVFGVVRSKYKMWVYALPLIAVLAVCWLNFRHTGVLHYSSITTINVANYNAMLCLSRVHGQEKADSITSALYRGSIEDEEAFQTYTTKLNDHGKKVLTKHWKDYLFVSIFGGIKMVVDPGRFDLYSYFQKSDPEISLTQLLYAGNLKEITKQVGTNVWLLSFLILGAAAGVFRSAGLVLSLFYKPKKAYVLGLLFVLYFVLLTGPLGAARFLLPVGALFCALAAQAWSALFQKSSKR